MTSSLARAAPAARPDYSETPGEARHLRRRRRSNPAARDHGQHSIALLLPTGKILVGGSERGEDNADRVKDKRYELFSPPNIACDNRPRPVILDPDPNDPAEYLDIHYGAASVPAISYSFTPIDATVVDRVVLARPGAVTHARDADQRVIELQILSHQAGSIEVAAPSPAEVFLIPPGHSMLFLLTDQGDLCQRAGWARVRYL